MNEAFSTQRLCSRRRHKNRWQISSQFSDIFFLSLAPIFQGRRINKNDLLEEIRVAGFVNHLIKKDGLNFNNVKTLLLYPFISVFYKV